MKEIPGLNYRSPKQFSLSQRIGLALYPPVVSWVMYRTFSTCRFSVSGNEFLVQALNEHRNVLMAIWHETLGMAAYFFRNTGYHTLTSYSYDGELAARLVRHFGLSALRGSSSRGGSEAVRDMAAALEHVTVGFTLDGPKGPRRVAKAGIGIVAARAGVPIVPVALNAAPAWRMNSWDRLIVPKPWSRVTVKFGPAIPGPAANSSEAIEAVRAQVERELNTLHGEIEG